MTDNLIERLRGYGDGNNDLMDAAADHIEKLEAALRKIVGALDDPKGGQHVYDMRNASYIARKALDAK